MSNKDNFTKLIGDLDQVGATLESIAPIVWQYFIALRREGFTREEALVLVRDWMQTLFPSKPSKPAE